MNPGSTSLAHDKLIVAMLKTDPLFSEAYLAEALDQSDQPGGQHALLLALRNIAEAQGFSAVAQAALVPLSTRLDPK